MATDWRGRPFQCSYGLCDGDGYDRRANRVCWCLAGRWRAHLLLRVNRRLNAWAALKADLGAVPSRRGGPPESLGVILGLIKNPASPARESAGPTG